MIMAVIVTTGIEDATATFHSFYYIKSPRHELEKRIHAETRNEQNKSKNEMKTQARRRRGTQIIFFFLPGVS